MHGYFYTGIETPRPQQKIIHAHKYLTLVGIVLSTLAMTVNFTNHYAIQAAQTPNISLLNIL